MITLHCPAKLNLFLKIGPKDVTGYHFLDSILVRVDHLADRLMVEAADRLSLECESLPCDESNTVLKAIRVMEAATGRHFLYRIQLEKKIPVEAGLGGGSSNAASIMVFLNAQENLGISNEALLELGAKVGMDVPFFISGHPVAHASHYGEQIQALPDLPPNLKIELYSGPAQSTAAAYQAWDAAQLTSTAEVGPMLEAIRAKDSGKIIQNLHNDFQKIIVLPPSLASDDGWILAGSGGAFAAVYEQNKKPPKTQESQLRTQ